MATIYDFHSRFESREANIRAKRIAEAESLVAAAVKLLAQGTNNERQVAMVLEDTLDLLAERQLEDCEMLANANVRR